MLASDLEAVMALEHELFPEDAWSPEMFADEVGQPPDARLYLVAEREARRGRWTEWGGRGTRQRSAGPARPGTHPLEPPGHAESPPDAERGLGYSRAGSIARTPPVPEALAGYAGMMFVPGAAGRGGGSADVLTIAVARDCWGQGIGSALLESLIAQARRRKCAEVFLEVREDNPRARGLYLRRGFMEIGVRRGYYQPANVDAIVMRKDLETAT
jgi:ribosomal-protein-alanine N-acetyltransferase